MCHIKNNLIVTKNVVFAHAGIHCHSTSRTAHSAQFIASNRQNEDSFAQIHCMRKIFLAHHFVKINRCCNFVPKIIKLSFKFKSYLKHYGKLQRSRLGEH